MGLMTNDTHYVHVDAAITQTVHHMLKDGYTVDQIERYIMLQVQYALRRETSCKKETADEHQNKSVA